LIRVAHVINGLSAGGAETMLVKLLSGMDRARFSAEVVSLKGAGALGGRIESLGVRLTCLELPRAPWRALGLAGLLKARADVAQTWLYQSDLLGGLAARRAGVPAVWGLRQSNLEPRFNPGATLWAMRACARLSASLPARIVCNSEASRRAHAAAGYAEERMTVIPNGFDTEAFRPDPSARAWLRAELGLPADAPLVGLVARFHPVKGHRVFIEAAALAARRHAEARFLLCGDGVDRSRELADWVRAAGLDGRLFRLGARADVARIDAGLDVLASASFGESFPNAVGEAMACGVPCAVTDAGDSRVLVGETGEVVPPGDAAALAAALDRLLGAGAEALRRRGAAARARVLERYSLATAARRYEDVYAAAAGKS
jgi:glycosyltransferase involved in cell wall biosynthesis